MMKTLGACPQTPGVYPLGTAGSKEQNRRAYACGLPVSHGKRRVALLRCPVNAVTKVLTTTWMIIPFTRLNIQNRMEKCCRKIIFFFIRVIMFP